MTTPTNTDAHRMTFAVRDDLAETLEDIVDGDSRITVNHDTDRFWMDLAEELISRGWVTQHPTSEESS